MSREEYVEIVRDAVAKLLVLSAESVTEETNLTVDLNADSVIVMQIMCEIEDRLDIDLNMMDFRRRKTVGELADYVQEEDEG